MKLRADLNWLCIVGLCCLPVAVVVMMIDNRYEGRLTVSYLLGADAPWAVVPLWMVIAVLGAVIYLAGRVLWLIRFRLPR